jgi:hypothetical protein
MDTQSTEFTPEPDVQEAAVRNYLKLLADPQSLVDEREVNTLAEKLQASHDPLERLSLRSQLDGATRPPTHAVEDAFVAHSLAWARRENISAEAFQAEGVSLEVLARAGFPVSDRRRRGRGAASVRRTRTRVRVHDVAAAIPKEGKFTIRDLMQQTGGSRVVVAKAVEQQMDAGRVRYVGRERSGSVPGRAPIVYEATSG